MVRKILLIDDDRLQYRFTEAHFRGFHGETYELEWTDSYDSGLKKLLTGAYAACLLDFQLGDRDGLQLIREAAALGNTTPIVFLTAESSPEIDMKAMDAGALDYLVKGEISPASLQRALRYAVKLGETLQALRRLSTHDPLTGFLNRWEFERRLGVEENRARRTGQPLALFMIDVDRFKAVNDRHGHPAGDDFLRGVAQRLQEVVRSGDAAARFGGDEFALLLVETDLAAAQAVAERIRAAMHREKLAAGDGVAVPVTVSLGAAVLVPGASPDLSLVAEADKELYRAKAAGRDRASLAEAGAP